MAEVSEDLSSDPSIHIPEVDQSIIPQLGMKFSTVEEGYNFYKKYADASGFTIRSATVVKKGEIIQTKYFLCSKEGFKKPKPFDSANEDSSSKVGKRAPSIRVGCRACIRIRLDKDKRRYEVYFFNAQHNHSFVEEDDWHLLPSNRGLTYQQEEAISSLAEINIGPVRAFNIMRSLYGGFNKVGATKTDFKNFRRDLNKYVGQNDADMLIKRLNRKKEYLPNFSFDFFVNEKGELAGAFWADEQAKRNFLFFGDVVSFDATYRRNKYKMMFVPFTGVDNHNRNVTLGAAIIGNETADTYKWLLGVSKKAFGSAPPVIVTDQDPAMKKAIEETCPDSRHRLCTWHIMDKLAVKVGAVLCNTTDFKQRLCFICWNDTILPEEFESKWAEILNDFGLTDHDWLNSIYKVRESWVPAYFRNEKMSGLMRTSSRSESENHFFGKFCNPGCTLVEFLGHFDAAIEAQRHEHRKNDHDTRNTIPDIWSDYPLERQAYRIYTRTLFFDVQLEIQDAIHSCTQQRFVEPEEPGGFMKFYVKDWTQLTTRLYEVMLRKEDMNMSCSCLRFEQFGLLCSHIFCVLRVGEIREFPKNYILPRWTREAVPNTAPGESFLHDSTMKRSEDVNRVIREITYTTETYINKVVEQFETLCSFRDHIKEFMPKAIEANINAPRKSRRDRFAELCGETPESNIVVRVPVGTRFKGMSKPKRFRSKREQAISQGAKKRRQCQNCMEYGHNIRTCTNPKKVDNEDDTYGEEDPGGDVEADEDEDE